MKTVIVLGSGCPNCKKTYELVDKKVKELKIDAKVEKNEDITELLKFGVMSTPAVVVDGKIVHVGGVPSEKDIIGWFNKASGCCCGSCGCQG